MVGTQFWLSRTAQGAWCPGGAPAVAFTIIALAPVHGQITAWLRGTGDGEGATVMYPVDALAGHEVVGESAPPPVSAPDDEDDVSTLTD